MRIVFCLVLLLSGSAAWAEAREQLARFADGLESLSGSFRQTLVDQDGFVIEESSGTLQFLAPDRFRWDYAEPFPQQLVADGERLWHYDEALEQVTVRDQPELADSPLFVLLQPDLLERFYHVESGGHPDELHFIPLQDDGDFERARLFFAGGQPVALELTDRLVGQTTVLELRALIRNPGLEAGLFRFEPPPGVDVLEGY